MKLKNLLNISLLFCSISGSAQYSEIKEFGLKGPIKSVTTFVYTSWDENLVPDTTALFYKTYRHLNTEGMVDYFSSSYSFAAAYEGQITFLVSNLSFSFDSTGQKKNGSGITTRYAGDSIVDVSHETYLFEWISPYNYYERCYDASLGTKKGDQHVLLDEDYFIYRVEYMGFSDNDSIDYVYYTNYTKNAKGHIATSSETGTYDDAPVIQTYNYKSYDSSGNPTLIEVSTGGSIPDNKILMVKLYEYYN